MGLLDARGESCPCGSGTSLATCCGPYLRRTARPATAEQLMRSRYTAFVRGDADHLHRTWHPRTRPAEVVVDPRVRWVGLTVRDTVDGGEDDDTGLVTFEARFVTGQGPDVLVERSTFERRAGRWVYVDGERLG